MLEKIHSRVWVGRCRVWAVKILLFLGMACIIVGLYFHDKQQSAKLDTATAQVADLTQQLQSYQSAVYQLKSQLASFQSSAGRPAPVPQSMGNYQSPLSSGGLVTHGLDESH
jgi:hypothetical protein